MEESIETDMVSIVKVEKLEVKAEPPEDCVVESNEGHNQPVLGHFYEVECEADSEGSLMALELPTCPRVECPGAKEVERLEARVGRLECLLELLVSKVVAQSPKPAEPPQPSATTKDDSKTFTPAFRVASNLQRKSNGNAEQERVLQKGTNVMMKNSELIRAASDGNISRIEYLLAKRPTIREASIALEMTSSGTVVEAICKAFPALAKGRQGEEAVLLAAELGRPQVLRALLDAGADPNACNRSTATALHKAAAMDRAECVEVLVNWGADITATTRFRYTALHMAAMRGSTDSMTLLIEAGIDIEAKDRVGCTALHYACFNDQLEAILLLLNAGASPISKNRQGQTPRDMVTSDQALNIITLQKMVSRGKDTVSFLSSVDEIDEDEVPLNKRMKVKLSGIMNHESA